MYGCRPQAAGEEAIPIADIQSKSAIGLAMAGQAHNRGSMEQPPHPSAGFGDAAAPVLSGELIL